MLLFHSCHQWVHLPKTEKLYRFSGGKAALVARVLGAGEAQGKENPDEQQSSSSEDQEDNDFFTRLLAYSGDLTEGPF